MADYNIANSLREVAGSQADDIGLVAKSGDHWREFTFAQLQETCCAYATSLQEEGVKRGDRVMLMVRPSMEFICLTFALFQLGAVVILIDPGMGYKNLLRCIGGVRPDILVGIPPAIVLSNIVRGPFASIRKRICVTRASWWPGTRLVEKSTAVVPAIEADKDELAAIIFTTGSTGPPKGVQYTHGIFHAQLHLIKEYYGIGPGDVDQPGFPLFALFSTALGAKAVIPDMDPTKPAQVNPAKFVKSIEKYQVSYSFGSPAIWNVVSRYCLDQGRVLPVKKILMAGAPVPGELIDRVQQIMAPGGAIYTPYGATESLPIASISGQEVVGETWAQTRVGKGTCVGRPLPGITIKVIANQNGPLDHWSEASELPAGEIGEIVVQGPVVTKAYDGNDSENNLAKVPADTGFWHRMGDMGYFDHHGRLWFCGRKAHRVLTADGPMYSVPCEAIFNEHPQVFRSALVGIGESGSEQPVLIVELNQKDVAKDKLFNELSALAEANPLTEKITSFLIHPAFPVDIRHNAKIFREKLAAWAGRQSLGIQAQG